MERRQSRRKPTWQTDIAKERIAILLKQADKEFAKRPDLSRRYVELARRIGMKFNVRMNASQKMRFCRKCGAFLVYGKNAKQRLNNQEHKVEVTCDECKNVRSIPYVKEIKAKRLAKKG